MLEQTSIPVITGTLHVQRVCVTHRPALVRDNNYSLPITLCVSDADSAKRDHFRQRAVLQ